MTNSFHAALFVCNVAAFVLPRHTVFEVTFLVVNVAACVDLFLSFTSRRN